MIEPNRILFLRGEQYRQIKDNLENEPGPDDLAPIQSIVLSDSGFLEEEFKIILRKRAQSWVYQVQSSNRKTKIFNACYSGNISKSKKRSIRSKLDRHLSSAAI